MRLVPLGKPTFPDQQQDLQNAAGFSLASECDGSVKFARLVVETDSGAIWLTEVDWVGWGVSQVKNSLCDHTSDRARESLRSLKSSNRSFRRGLPTS